MKKVMILILSLIFTTNVFSQEEGFDTDRIPIGDPDRKFDFTLVKENKILNTKTQSELSYENLIKELLEYRIVMVGETHTNQLHHDVQMDVIKGLNEAGKTVIIALEMFNASQEEALLKWTSGEWDEERFLNESGFFVTWGHNYRYYRDIFKYAQDHHIRMYGVNVPGKYARRINRVGLAGLTEEEKAAIPEVDVNTVEHKFFFKVAMQGMDATMPEVFDNIYAAQSLWDAAMGEGAFKLAQQNPDAVVVVLAGSGHVIYNLGIGRIIRDRSDVPFCSVVTVDVSKDMEESSMMMVRKSMKKEENIQMGATSEKPGFLAKLFKKKKSKKSVVVSEKMPKSMDMPANKMPAKMEKSKPGMMAHMPQMDDAPYRVVVRSLADYLWGKPEQEHDKYPALGASIKDDDGKLLISRVLPKTIAFENGLKKNDIILKVNDKTFENAIQLKKYLTYINWNDKINYELERNGKTIHLSFVVTPLEDK